MKLAERIAHDLPPGSHLYFGELLLVRHENGDFEARHRDDDGLQHPPTVLHSVAELRDLAKYDASGAYRPLKTKPNLRSGWTTHTADAAEFLSRLDAIYPGAYATTVALGAGAIGVVPLRATLRRQTGMYGCTRELTDADAVRILDEWCATECLRQVRWPIDEGQPAPETSIPGPGKLPLVCTEACTFAVNKARELVRDVRRQQLPESSGAAAVGG